MSTISITVSNSFNLFGGGRTNRWGDAAPSGTTLVFQSAALATYNTLFGAQTDLELKIVKYVGNTVSFTPDPKKNITKQVDETVGLSDTTGKQVTKQVDETLNTTNSITTLTRMSGDWKYMYPPETSNIRASTSTVYTAVSASTSTWTRQSFTTTNWSEV